MSPLSAPLRQARRCYGHLAGVAGVALRAGLEEAGLLQRDGAVYRLTEAGRRWAVAHGIDHDDRDAARHARCCLDCSERVPHIGGRLGRDLLARLLACGAVEAGAGRALRVVGTWPALAAALAIPVVAQALRHPAGSRPESGVDRR